MKKIGVGSLAATAIAATLSLISSNIAATGGSLLTAPEVQASQAWGPGWMVRLRGIAVVPDEDGSNITAGGAPIAADITIDNSIVPELDLTYFFTPTLAAELILGVTPHDVRGTGVLQGALGDVWLLPPILLAQYHFNLGS